MQVKQTDDRGPVFIFHSVRRKMVIIELSFEWLKAQMDKGDLRLSHIDGINEALHTIIELGVSAISLDFD